MKRELARLLLPSTLALLLPLQPGAQIDPFALDDVPEAEAAPVFENYAGIGFGFLDDDGFAFGHFSGLTDAGFEAVIDFRLQSRPQWDGKDTTFWRFEGARVGQDSRRIEMQVGQQGAQQLSIVYRGIPNFRYDDGSTPFNGAGSTFLGLPPDWQVTGGTTGDMPVLESSLADQNINHMRDRLEVGFQRVFSPRLSMDADFRREIKEGERIVGGVIGNSGGNRRSALLPAPIDFVTDVFDLSLTYAAEHYQIGVAGHGSFFENERESVTWQNPFGPVGGQAAEAGFPDGLGRTALEPDNRHYQIRVFGAYSFVPGATRVSANLTYGRMEQDADFLPFTVNAALDAPVPLPRTDLDGRIDTTLIDVRVSSRPARRLNLAASFRYDDRDNETPREVYLPVRGDSQDQELPGGGRINLPYSSDKWRANADLRYRLGLRTRLVAGYTRSQTRRDFQEVSRVDEDVYRFGVQLQPVQIASLDLDFIRSERDGTRYDGVVPFFDSHEPGAVDPDDPLDFENHPALRKFHLADRDRNEIRARADLFPLPMLSIGAQASYGDDDFEDGLFGLEESTVQAYTVDVSVFPAPDLSFSAFYTHERFDSDIAGRSFRGSALAQDFVDPERNWFVNSDDRIDSAGFSLEAQDLGRRIGKTLNGQLDLGIDFMFSRSRSEMDVDSGAALTTAPLPDLVTRLLGFGVSLHYQWNDDRSVRLRFEHERLDSRDYALDGVAPGLVDEAGRVLALGVASPGYKANWVTVTLRQHF